MSTPLNLDHVVVATNNLAATVRDFEEATGVAPQAGGVHPQFGTRNYLVTFGGRAYLELIGVDPDIAVPGETRMFNLHRVITPVVATFAIHPSDPDDALRRAADLGLDLGPLAGGQRRDTEGNLLEWRLTRPLFAEESGVIPFLIDWGSTPTPAETVRAAAALDDFLVAHPDPDWVRQRYAALGTDLPVARADQPSLSLTVSGPGGAWTVS